MAKQQCLSVITEPSEDAVKVDRYVSAPLIGQHPAEWQQIGGYAIPALQLRTPANAPGVLRNDVVGQLRTAGMLLRRSGGRAAGLD